MTGVAGGSVSLDLLKKMMDDFAKERNWEQFHSPRNLLLALVNFLFISITQEMVLLCLFWILVAPCSVHYLFVVFLVSDTQLSIYLILYFLVVFPPDF